MLGYLYDDAFKERLNRSGLDYWDVYIREIIEQLGLRGAPCSLKEIENGDGLRPLKILIIGYQSGEALSETARMSLEGWVKNGGILIGFGLLNFDGLFGIQSISTIKQTPDNYSISGYLDLQEHRLTAGVHSPAARDQKLVIVSDIRCAALNGAGEIGRLYDAGGQATEFSAATWAPCGRGYAGYFAFDVAKTIWLLHQGRPVTEPEPGEAYARAGQMQIIGENSRKVAYADELLFILQNMIAQYPCPFIDQIPPKDGKPADALFFWGGDGCASTSRDFVTASNWMKARKLPYHVNVYYASKDRTFNLQATDAAQVKANGHELAPHYNFTKHKLTREEVIRQQKDFTATYGLTPVCTVNHCCCWAGWAEPARWMAECGGQADNSFIGNNLPLVHPMANGPFFGFGFGTAYPFYFYADSAGGNRRIDFLEEPIACYEVGHMGSVQDRETAQLEKVREAVDYALAYHATMNFFYHAFYISRFPRCREAIEEILRYVAERRATVAHMAPDRLCAWWRARSRAALGAISVNGRRLCFQAACDWPDGMVVKIPVGTETTAGRLTMLCDGQPLPCALKSHFGSRWCFAALPAGTHAIELAW